MQASLIAAKKPGPPECGDIFWDIFGDIFGDLFGIYEDYFCRNIYGNISGDIEEY